MQWAVLLSHGALGASLIVLIGGTQTNEDFSAGLEEDLRFWFIDFVDVAAKVLDEFREHLFDVRGVGFCIAGL